MPNVRRLLVLLVGLALFAGCTNQTEDTLGHSDDDGQAVASSEELLNVWTTEGEWRVSPVLDAPEGVLRVGALLSLASPAEMPALSARILAAGEPISDWIELEATWSEDAQHVAIANFAEVGQAAQLRVRAEAVEIIDLLTWNAVIPEAEQPEDLAGSEGDLGEARAEIRSELRGTGIVTREQWGARATRCTSRNASKTKFAIHHTVTGSSNPASQMRGIQRYHMDSRGWCDVGYHFLIGQDGRVYEGRPVHLLGAHVGGNNTGNIGVSFIGCFHTSGCGGLGSTTPNQQSIRVAGRLLGTLSRLYGVNLSSSTVRGHRDHPGQSTSCPGNNLYSRISSMISTGRSETLSGGNTGGGNTGGGNTGGGNTGGGNTGGSDSGPGSAPTCRHSYGGTYSHLGCSNGYQCCSGAWRTRGSCGQCACVEGSGQTGCTVAPAPTEGASCTHSYGATYANRGCSAGYQCCDGRWRVRGASNSCGSCACVEESGYLGCSERPAGSPCNHTYGGRYASGACSASYQCCDGNWQRRADGGCGSCYCTETSGERGCGL